MVAMLLYPALVNSLIHSTLKYTFSNGCEAVSYLALDHSPSQRLRQAQQHRLLMGVESFESSIAPSSYSGSFAISKAARVCYSKTCKQPIAASNEKSQATWIGTCPFCGDAPLHCTLRPPMPLKIED
jgi:hypothetical protein